MEIRQQNRSPKSPSIPIETLELPDNIITYFRKTGKYLENLPAYEKIEGTGISTEIPVNAYGLPSCETAPITHHKKEDLDYALKKSREAFGIICNKEYHDDIEIISREYMLNGLTKPIRICASKGEIKKTIYVKKPSVERVFGFMIYNILSGFDKTEFYFNNSVFIEEEIEGRLVNSMTMAFLRNDDTFKRSAIRLDLIDKLMIINDLDKRDNFILTPRHEARAFDFDCMLLKLDNRKGFIDYLISDEYFAFDSKEVYEIIKREKIRMNNVINVNSKRIENILWIMDSMDHFRNAAKEYDCNGCLDLFYSNLDKHIRC